MNPCFICATPTEGFRSLTQLTAPPAGPHDSVPLCPSCQNDWSFALISLVRLELAGLDALAKPSKNQPDPRRNNHPNSSTDH